MTFWKVVDWLLDSLAAVLLLVMSSVLALEVVFRYLINRPLSWTLEVSLFCFVWLVWLGAVGSMREERQIRIDFAETYSPKQVKRILLPANTILSMVFLVFVIYYGVQVTESQMSAVYDILPFSRGILYAAAPLGGTLMFLTLARVLVPPDSTILPRPGGLRERVCRMDLLILFGTLVVLMLLGVPISFSMGVSGVFFLLVTGQWEFLIMIPNRMVMALDSYGLMAIPFFYLAGSLMLIGGLTLRLVAFSRAMIGHVTGGLSLVNVIASMIFAGVSGSCVADASAIGSVLIPAMKKDRYRADFSAAVTASAATCGHIIPPSIPMVLIGVMQEMPIGKLFLAGAIPGILLGFSLMGTAYVISRRRNYPKEERRSTLREMGRAFLDGFLTLIMPGIVVGGIVFGVVTITETGVLACVYALILGFIYREIRFDNFWAIAKETARGVSNLLIILASAGFFGYVVMNTGVGDQLVALILSISTNKWMVLSMLVIFLLIIGCGLDVLAIIFIFVPVMYPLIHKVGINPYHFSAVFVLSLGIALLTPPVGVLLYLASDMAEAPLIGVIRELVPFLLIEVAVMLLVTYVPVLSTWLPSLMTK